MIGYLEGKVLKSDSENTVIVAGGVGYEVHCSQFTCLEIGASERAELWVYTHVREDILQLYGFTSIKEKELFLSLIKVNGVGPKMALGVLSAARYEQIVSMVEQGDVKGLTKLPKVGKKTAEQMILTLKGKLVLENETPAQRVFSARDDIVSALVNLGFKLPDVEFVVDKMDATVDLQQGVRKGLAALTTRG